MTPFIACFPSVFSIIAVLLFALFVILKLLNKKRKYPSLLFGLLTLITSILIIMLIWRLFFTNATPSEKWREKAKETNTVILFGFGYDTCKCGLMRPGNANEALYKMAINNARKDIGTLHLIMQEGVRVAAIYDINPHEFIRDFIPMHPHDSTYITTLIAAKYAILKMDSLGVKKAVVYAHSMQLKRAVYDLRRIADSEPRWKDMEFITPEIRSTPFPCCSVHKHTRSVFLFYPREIFASRPVESVACLSKIHVE